MVTGPSGPEAGVWVIAETRDLPTKFARIVVTDDAGRYLIPDLPPASYDVWVRGYGLVDSPKLKAEPGSTMDLRATVAPDIRSLDLAPGVYSVDAAIHARDGSPYDYRRDVLRFEVSAERASAGVWNPDRAWSFAGEVRWKD
jgi:hypothetical protein